MKTSQRAAGAASNYVDERTGAAKWMKKNLTKVFPDHWSFMLGEICLYSFVILLLTGTFLTFWFDPSQREVIGRVHHEVPRQVGSLAGVVAADEGEPAELEAKEEQEHQSDPK